LVTPFLGVEQEYNIRFAKDYLTRVHVDYFIFGHRHIPMDIKLSESSRLINLGEWIVGCTFAEFDGEHLTLRAFDQNPNMGKVQFIRI
jgi:UDP-2,3-diacylglucosamine hydrolase